MIFLYRGENMKKTKEDKKIIMRIDKDFIKDWALKYNEIVKDEIKYQEIKEKVKEELENKKTIEKSTFKDIIFWKSPRLKGVIRLNQYDIYKKAIAKSHKAVDKEKIKILCKLYGVGVPVVSTILHFMYPGEFPIIDFRTVETLFYAGYIQKTTISEKQYIPFKKAILEIRKKTNNYSLRKIDRALFAYHKEELNKNIKGKNITERRDSIEKLRKNML